MTRTDVELTIKELAEHLGVNGEDGDKLGKQVNSS